jgi:hypothetical protein
MLFTSCMVLTRVRRYLFICHIWKTLLNHVFEDLRKTEAPNTIRPNNAFCRLSYVGPPRHGDVYGPLSSGQHTFLFLSDKKWSGSCRHEIGSRYKVKNGSERAYMVALTSVHKYTSNWLASCVSKHITAVQYQFCVSVAGHSLARVLRKSLINTLAQSINYCYRYVG